MLIVAGWVCREGSEELEHGGTDRRPRCMSREVLGSSVVPVEDKRSRVLAWWEWNGGGGCGCGVERGLPPQNPHPPQRPSKEPLLFQDPFYRFPSL